VWTQWPAWSMLSFAWLAQRAYSHIPCKIGVTGWPALARKGQRSAFCVDAEESVFT